MTRTEAITALQARAAAVRAMGATGLYLFGSTLRDAAQPESDLDLFVDYDPGSRFNAFDLIGIKLFLEEELGTAVHATARDGLHPVLGERAERAPPGGF